MALDIILQALEAEGERQVADIAQTAQHEAACIRDDALTKAATERQQHIADIQPSLQAEQARIVNQAKMEALRTVLRTREELIASILEAAAQRLEALSTTHEYGALLRRLTQEGIDRLGMDGQLRLQVRSQDVALMRQALREMGLDATVEGGLESETSPWGCLGGVIITTSDARISLANTLATRLQSAARRYRSHIATLVGGGSQEG